MKHPLLPLFCAASAALLLTAASPAPSKDCTKASDACSSAPAHRSLFLDAAAAPVKPAAVVKEPPPAVPERPAAAVEASTAAAPAAPAAGQQPSAFSNPLWTLFAAGGLGGLYLYLKSGSARRRRK